MEQWKEVRPGLEVSNLGRARRYITGHLDSDRYVVISGGRRGGKKERLHALIAEAFLGPAPDGAIVRHLDDVKANNAVTNLAYGDHRDNARDHARNGHVHWTRRPENTVRVREWARRGGQSWKGRKRQGLRGKAR